MRYCQIYDSRALGRITMRQYAMMMRATRLRIIDNERDLHMQAWLNARVKDQKRQGKKTVPVYKSFGSFYKAPEPDVRGRAEPHGVDELKAIFLKANTR